MVALLLMWSTRVSQTRFLAVPVDDAAQASRIAARERSLDWAQEFADAGFMPRPELSNSLVQALTAAEIRLSETEVQFVVTIDFINLAVVGDSAAVKGALDFVERRLSLEAAMDAVAAQPAEKRRRRQWEIFGSGFDSLARTFLAAQAGRDPDPEVRAHAQRLLEALPAE